MSRLSHLKISQRVMLFALVALAGIIVIAGIFLWQRQIEAEFRLGVDRLTRLQQEIASMDGDLRDTLLWEQQFLLTRDPASIDRFQVSHTAVSAAVERLRSGAAPALISDLDALKSGLEHYAGGFARLVKDNEDLGLNPSSGFEGVMRGAVHSIEEQLKAVDDANIRASMLMLRRHEKDFILRRDAKYIEAMARRARPSRGWSKKLSSPAFSACGSWMRLKSIATPSASMPAQA